MRTRILLLILSIALLTACSIKVRSNYDHTVDFRKYKSFCWMKGCEFRYIGPKYLQDSSTRKYFKSAIMEELSGKGLTYDDDMPDLLIDLQITVKNRSDVVFNNGQDHGMFFVPLAEPMIIDYLKGTLVIDIADRKTGRMIWRSAAVGYMDEHPKVTYEKVKNGIARVLHSFPPPSNADPASLDVQQTAFKTQ